MKEKKKRNKKYNPWRMDDYINPIEHQGSHLKTSSAFIKNLLLDNKFTINHLVNEGMFIYQNTFIFDLLSDEYNASNIRNWLESEFDKLDNISTKDELKTILSRKIKVHWQTRDLLIAFLDEVDSLICSLRSRTEYARIFNEALIRFNMRVNLVATSMRKFVNTKSIAEGQETCRRRLKRVELIKAKKDGKIAYFDETGDIVITEKRITK